MNQVKISNPSIINVQQNDNGIKIFFNITNNGIIEPIPGASIKLKFMDKIKNIVMNRTCEITDSELAECLYILKKEDLKYSGTFSTEIEIKYANGTILSLDEPFTLIVNPESIPNEDVNPENIHKKDII